MPHLRKTPARTWWLLSISAVNISTSLGSPSSSLKPDRCISSLERFAPLHRHIFKHHPHLYQIAMLERRRGEKLNEAALKIQKTWRGHRDHQHYRRVLHATIRIQTRKPPIRFPFHWFEIVNRPATTVVRSLAAKHQLRALRENAAAIRIQAWTRRFLSHSRYHKQLSALIYVQRVFSARRQKRFPIS